MQERSSSISFQVLVFLLLCCSQSSFAAGQPSTPYTQFIRKIQSQLKQQPRSARLHTILAQLYRRSGKLAEAQKYYGLALQYKPGYPHALAGQAQLSLLQKKWKKTRQQLQSILKKHPKQVLALSLFSDWYRLQAPLQKNAAQRKKYYKKSVYWMEKAVQSRPTLSRYRLRLGLLLLARRHFWKAHYHFLKLVALDNKRPCHHLGLALCESFFGRNWKKTLKRIQQLDKKCGHPVLLRLSQTLQLSLRVQLARSYATAGQWTKAIAELKDALKGSNDYTEVHNMLSWWLYSRKGCLQTQVFLQEWKRKTPNSTRLNRQLSALKKRGCAVRIEKKQTKPAVNR